MVYSFKLRGPIGAMLTRLRLEHGSCRELISEITCMPCSDLECLRLPTVLDYVLCLTFQSGCDSHSLPPFFY